MTGYHDNTTKYTFILNRNAPPGQLLNALGHLSIGLGANADDLLDYPISTTGTTALISRWPVIVLAAKSSTQLANTLSNANAANGIRTNAFTASMIGASAEQQIAATATQPVESIEYIGIGLFGPADLITPLTKKYSLMNALS